MKIKILNEFPSQLIRIVSKGLQKVLVLPSVLNRSNKLSDGARIVVIVSGTVFLSFLSAKNPETN